MKQVYNQMWLQKTVLRSWQGFSHTLDSSTGRELGWWCEHPEANVTPRKRREPSKGTVTTAAAIGGVSVRLAVKVVFWNSFNGTCLSVTLSCRTHWSGLDLDQGVYKSTKRSIAQLPLGLGVLAPPCGGARYDRHVEAAVWCTCVFNRPTVRTDRAH